MSRYHAGVVDFGGDICILLCEPVGSNTREPWQDSLRRRFGGMCTNPIHVTLQRIRANGDLPGTLIAEAVIKAFAGLAPITITGTRVEARFSPFRDGWIGKLGVLPTPEIMTFRETVNTAIRSLGFRGVIPALTDGQSLPVTVLERMDRPESLWLKSDGPPHVNLDEPVRVILDTVRVSRIRAAFDYEILHEWALT